MGTIAKIAEAVGEVERAETLLDELAALDRLCRLVMDARRHRVIDARKHHSAAEIGTALGVSRQAILKSRQYRPNKTKG